MAQLLPELIMEVSVRVRPGDHLRELDGVRGAAVLMVVLLHTIFGLTAKNFTIPAAQPIFSAFFGGAGVDLFFVLSGFLIGGILIDNKLASNYFKIFWIRRATRILPVYMLLMLSYVAAKAIGAHVSAPWFHAFLMQNPLPTWPYFCFLQNYFMAAANSGAARWVGITWSLCVEEQFYLIFPFVVYFIPKKKVLWLAAICIAIAPIVRSFLWSHYGFYTGYFPTPARADGLMFGVIAAYLIRSPKLKWFERKRVLFDAIAISAIYLLIWQTSAIDGSLQFSLRSALFCYAIIRIFISDDYYRVFLRSKFMVFMGLISYPFYMYHQAVNGLFHGLLLNQVPKIENWTGVAVGCAVLVTSGFLATISTEFYEKPIRNFGRKFKYARRPVELGSGQTSQTVLEGASKAHSAPINIT